MHIAIIDNDRKWSEKIEIAVKHAIDKVEFKKIKVYKYTSGHDFLINHKNKIDLLFMEVIFPREDGIKEAMSLRRQGAIYPIIFVTKALEKARCGYIVNAFRYIDKNHLEHEVREAMHALFDNTIKLNVLRKGKISIHLDSILYIDKDNRNTKVVTTRGVFICSEPIYLIRSILHKAKEFNFINIYRSILVNMDFIKDIDDKNIYLYNGDKLPITLRKYQDVYKLFMEK